METKKVIWDAGDKVYKEIYEKLDIKKAKKDRYKISQRSESLEIFVFWSVSNMRIRRFTLRLRDQKICRDYFNKLFNDSFTQDLGKLIIQCQDINHNFMYRIREFEVKKIYR